MKADIFTVKTTQKWDKDSKESEKLKSEQRGVSSGRSHTNDSESDNPYSPTRKQRSVGAVNAWPSEWIIKVFIIS